MMIHFTDEVLETHLANIDKMDRNDCCRLLVYHSSFRQGTHVFASQPLLPFFEAHFEKVCGQTIVEALKTIDEIQESYL